MSVLPLVWSLYQSNYYHQSNYGGCCFFNHLLCLSDNNLNNGYSISTVIVVVVAIQPCPSSSFLFSFLFVFCCIFSLSSLVLWIFLLSSSGGNGGSLEICQRWSSCMYFLYCNHHFNFCFCLSLAIPLLELLLFLNIFFVLVVMIWITIPVLVGSNCAVLLLFFSFPRSWYCRCHCYHYQRSFCCWLHFHLFLLPIEPLLLPVHLWKFWYQQKHKQQHCININLFIYYYYSKYKCGDRNSTNNGCIFC